MEKLKIRPRSSSPITSGPPQEPISGGLLASAARRAAAEFKLNRRHMRGKESRRMQLVAVFIM
jgi:hypothetical protein